MPQAQEAAAGRQNLDGSVVPHAVPGQPRWGTGPPGGRWGNPGLVEEDLHWNHGLNKLL